MNASHEKTANLTGVLKIQIEENDYKEKVEKAIRDLQKKAQMPGFRQGKVPMGIVKKMYGKNVLIEEVNKILSDSVYNYIKDNELDILGNPLPVHEKNNSIDWDNQKEFEFHFSLGFTPEFDLTLSDKIKVDYYKIKVEDDIIDEQINNLRQQYGKVLNSEESGEQDIMSGELVQLEDDESAKEEGITNRATIYISKINNEDIKSKFLSKKVGDQIIFDLRKAFGSDADAAQVAGVKEEELPAEGSLFRFVVEAISRIEPAELNEDLFNKIAPDNKVTSEQELRNMISEQISKQYQSEVDRYFVDDVNKLLIEKANIDIPQEFIKQLLVESDKENLTKEKVEAEFDNYAESLKWQLIENKIAKEYDLKVTKEEIEDYVKNYIRAQLQQYGQPNADDSMIENFMGNIMEKKEEVDKFSKIIFENKLVDLYKNNLKIKEKEITKDEFVNLVSEKNK